jgi:hypothetical protein
VLVVGANPATKVAATAETAGAAPS